MARTYEELLAAQTELMRFNPNHDNLGRFAKRIGGSKPITKVKNMSPRKQVAVGAATMAGLSALATVGNAINAKKALDSMDFGDKISVGDVVAKGAVKAGKVAIASALAIIGAQTVAMVRNASKKSVDPKHKPSLRDIDDQELIDLNMDDPSFRKEYNVTKAEYDDWKRRQKSGE